MQQSEDRLLTFVNWPSRIPVRPDQLAQAGFYYVGSDDYVKCFCCEGVLQCWQSGDDPWVVHAKWFPGCEYLLQEQGQDFVYQIQTNFPRLLKQLLTDRDHSTRECGRVYPPEVDLGLGVERFEDAIMMNTPVIKSALEMGFEHSLIKQTVQSKILTGENYETAEELVSELVCKMTVMSMKEPICLIETDSDGRLRVVPRAQKILQQIEQKVVVVSVVGLYRTGKSYLMNKLAGTNKGFPLGSTIQSKTKGIWMWCVPHPRKTDHTLVLLDTEGLGDIEKGDTTNDNWIFAMAVLLSSTLVYNSMGTIDNAALENLHYVTELTKHIKMKSNKDEDDDRTYVRFLPSFVWAVRDFSLDLEIDGKPITADEYLEHGLKEKQGKENERYKQPRACLRKFFPRRSCFVFERPANARTMKRMEELTDAELDPDFVEQAKEFTEHICTQSETKTLSDGIKVTGRLLGQLAETYVKAIRSGEVPCLDNAVKVLAEIENAKAVEQARVLYVQRMKSVRFPTNQEELSAIHASSEREALALFMDHSFKDDNHEYQKTLESMLEGEYDQICEKNFMESRDALVKHIFTPLENKLKTSYYTVSGGYNTFCKDMNLMKESYRLEACIRGLPLHVPNAFLNEKFRTGQTIQAVDEQLSKAQQRAEEAKAKREEAERDIQDMAKQCRFLERQASYRQRTHEEKMKRLMEKMERNRVKAEQRRIRAINGQEYDSDSGSEQEWD